MTPSNEAKRERLTRADLERLNNAELKYYAEKFQAEAARLQSEGSYCQSEASKLRRELKRRKRLTSAEG